MTAKQKVTETLEGWDWLRHQLDDKIRLMDQWLVGQTDRGGIVGLLKRQREDAVIGRDREIPMAEGALREVLSFYADERSQAGKKEKKGTKAWCIQQAMESVLRQEPNLDGDDLYNEVTEHLEHHSPAKFPRLFLEGKEIRRTLRRYGVTSRFISGLPSRPV